MICPVCENGVVKDWYCFRCNSYFWKDARGLITTGHILEMHLALLKGDCVAITGEMPNV
jgi:hypothetical protein